ncbi:MAG: VWA domain-containing protein [Planctomycetota bacterium]|nr:MAG: VWA domain-containing protein [Planctomycetota bacterium]
MGGWLPNTWGWPMALRSTHYCWKPSETVGRGLEIPVKASPTRLEPQGRWSWLFPSSATSSDCRGWHAAWLLSVAAHIVVVLLASCTRLPSASDSMIRWLVASSTVEREVIEPMPRFEVLPAELEVVVQTAVPEVTLPHILADPQVDAFSGSAGAPLQPSEVARLLRAAGTTSTGKGAASSVGLRGRGSAAGGWGAYPQFNRMLHDLRRGLDLVIVFDSTTSMGPEIDVLKIRFLQLGGLVLRALPNTRIACVTYKDIDDPIPVAYTPLTNNLHEIQRFLQAVQPFGGGPDIAEAVHLGLLQATRGYAFRRDAVKVILLFGDAPPRREDLAAAIWTAQSFAALPRAFVSTVTVRSTLPLPEFQMISAQGQGEAVALMRSDHVLQELFLLVFKQVNREQAKQFLQLP